VCALLYFFFCTDGFTPISDVAKGVLWFIFFGLAKTFQYAGLTILGVEGWKRLKSRFKKRIH
jgi:phosphoglycolate phosphatase